MSVESYIFETSMGSINANFGHPLDFLSDQEKKDFDEIGYTGKLNGVKTSRTEYLNSLGKGEFSILQTKCDNGDFTEKFVLTRATKTKTATISIDSIKDSDGWYSLAHELGLEDNTYNIFEYGEYANITIEVDENLNIVSGKIHPFKPLK